MQEETEREMKRSDPRKTVEHLKKYFLGDLHIYENVFGWAQRHLPEFIKHIFRERLD